MQIGKFWTGNICCNNNRPPYFVASDGDGSMRFWGRGNHLDGNTRLLAWQLLIAFVCVTVATGLRLFLDPLLFGVPFITFFPAVAVAAYVGGTAAGILTTLSGGIIASYFWVLPVRQWALSEQGVFTVGIYLLLSGLILIRKR